jgi:hypothetical protein
MIINNSKCINFNLILRIYCRAGREGHAGLAGIEDRIAERQ